MQNLTRFPLCDVVNGIAAHETFYYLRTRSVSKTHIFSHIFVATVHTILAPDKKSDVDGWFSKHEYGIVPVCRI